MKVVVIISLFTILLQCHVFGQVLAKSPVLSSDENVRSSSANVYSVREGFQQNTKANKSVAVKQSANINVFPNPTSAYTSISIDNINADYKILITDIIGNKIKEFSASDPAQFNIDCRDWSTGVYLISLISDRSVLNVKKLVISK